MVKLQNYIDYKLCLQVLQILMIISAVKSGNVIETERPIEKDLEEYLSKVNSSDETLMNFKKYLDEVESVKHQMTKKKDFDMGTVLKLLDSVELSLLLIDFDVSNDTDDQTAARNFLTFTKNKIHRSLSRTNENEQKSVAEIIRRIKRGKKVQFKEHDHDVVLSKERKETKEGKEKEDFTRAFLGNSGKVSVLEEEVRSYLRSFIDKQVFHYGIESVYEPRQVIELAYDIKKRIIDNKNFERIAMSENVRKLISALPECLQTLITSKKVCILNREYGIFLYAPAGPIFFHDDHRRYLFGWDGPGNPGKTDFSVEYLGGDEFRFMNGFYEEYMYASNVRYDKNRRHVMQWIPGTPVDGSVWKLALGKNYCSLYNAEYDELLCLDDTKENQDRRFAFTCAKTTDGKSQFRFINCDFQS